MVPPSKKALTLTAWMSFRSMFHVFLRGPVPQEHVELRWPVGKLRHLMNGTDTRSSQVLTCHFVEASGLPLQPL